MDERETMEERYANWVASTGNPRGVLFDEFRQGVARIVAFDPIVVVDDDERPTFDCD